MGPRRRADKPPQCVPELRAGPSTQNAPPVSFAEFQDAVPPILRLLLAIAITVGLSILFVHLFHRQLLELNASPKKQNDDDPDPPPGVKDISGRLIALTTFAFVFLLGFGFSQFWGTAKDARDAAFNEAIDYQRTYSAAQQLPPDQGMPIIAALEDYRDSVVTIEWPLMQDADSNALAAQRFDAGAQLSEAVLAAKTADASPSEILPSLSGAVDDLLGDAIDRTNALPSPTAVALIVLVFVLGIANLIAIVLFQPARKKANVVLVAMMATITAFLLFAIVEISNPYTGAGAITSRLMER